MAAEVAPISAPYPLVGRDQPIELHRGRAELRQRAEPLVSGDVLVSLTWLPSPNIAFELVAQAPDLSAVGDAELVVGDLPGSPVVPVFVGSASFGQARGVFREAVTFGEGPLTHVDFMIPNWPAIWGESITSRRGDSWRAWRGRVTLEDRPWEIRLEARADIREIVRELSGSRSFAPTYVGRVTRADGREFSVPQAHAAIEALNLFLGLARGFWTPPLLPVGYHGEEVVWREWLGRRASEWQSNFAWFSPRHPQALADAFPLFMQRWRDPVWRQSLELGVEWFVEANGHVNAETSIVLGQIALELFSWIILVEERGRISRRAFKKRLEAADKIIDLLKWAEIPLDIPESSRDLRALAAAEKWKSGAHALIGFRNKLTHPRGRVGDIFAAPITARIELRELALWYVELILLRFCGYRGDYLNRHTVGTIGAVESVPWR